MSLLDALNDIDSRQFDPAEVTAKDEAACLPAALEALHTSEADGEAVASQTSPSSMPALARYINDLGLNQGINLMTETRRFEREIIERALELTEGNQKHAAKLLGLQSSTLNAKVKKYGLKATRRKAARP
jgi:DNA-binding NtrC family response regulator